MTKPFALSPGTLTLADLRTLHAGERPITLDPACRGPVAAAAGTVADTLASGQAVYGVNTGFGALARTRIAPDQVSLLQHRLVLSHSAGTGALLPDAVVRLVMALKIAALGQGYSGVRPELVERWSGWSTRASIRAFRLRARSARRVISHRSPISAPCCWARARCASRARCAPPPTASPAPGSRRLCSPPRRDCR